MTTTTRRRPRPTYGAGRRPYVNPQVPTVAIDRIMGRVHVGTSPQDVETMIRKRIGDIMVFAPDEAHHWTETLKAQTVRYALWVHARNRGQYQWVMGGH
jgi:hypothetical protein